MGNRFWFFMYPIPITIIGFAIYMATDNFGARYFSLFLMCFIFSMNGTTYACKSTSTSDVLSGISLGTDAPY